MDLYFPPSLLREFLVCPRRFWYRVNLPGIEDDSKLDEYKEISELLSNTDDLKYYPRPDRFNGHIVIDFKQGTYTRAADVIQLVAYLCLYEVDIGLLYYLKANKIIIYKRDEAMCKDIEELDKNLIEIAHLPYPPEGSYDPHICKYCSFRDVCPRGMLDG